MAEPWRGRASAPGQATGPAHVVHSRRRRLAPRKVIGATKRAEEAARLQTAVDKVGASLRRTEALLEAGSISEAGDLVQALVTSHHAVLSDPLFVGAALTRVLDEGLLAEWALEHTLDDLRARFARLTRPEFRSWFRDVEGLSAELTAELVGQSPGRYLECDLGDIVVASALTISDVITLIQRGAAGVVLEAGSLTSHVAVLCRSAGLPAVTGLRGIRAHIHTDQRIRVDGNIGTVARASALPVESTPVQTFAPKFSHEHNNAMIVRANLDIRLEADWARSHGTTGVGLWRTFFHYLGRTDLPTEDELTRRYATVLADFAPEPVTIRLVDLSGPFDEEELPTILRGLGECRGIRIRHERPGLLKTQIRAMVRAAPHGNLRILIPFVTEVADVAWVQACVAEAQAALHQPDTVPVGAMVEVPAALFILDELAELADFLAIGSNDLGALLFAQPRDSSAIANTAARTPWLDEGTRAPSAHPALLRAIAHVVTAANKAGVDVSLCGELASNIEATQQLFELGLRELSVSPRLAPAVHAIMKKLPREGS